MQSELHYGQPDGEELPLLLSIIEQSLHIRSDRMPILATHIEQQNFRKVTLKGKIVGGLAILRMGQWFGGVNIPMAGITTVAVAPEYRGKGVANFLMQNVILELQKEGIPLSGLYPATHTLYRKVGYEKAGVRFLYEMDPRMIQSRDRRLDIELLTEENLPELFNYYKKWAKNNHGLLDRHPLLWKKLFYPLQQKESFRYLIKNGSQIEGHLIYTQGKAREEPLEILDYSALTDQAALRIMTFLSDHSSMINSVRWGSGPHDQLLAQLSEPTYQVKSRMEWMVRILDIKKALELRSYSSALSGEWSFFIEDPLIKENHGAFVLTLDKGKAQVKTGGDGKFKLTINSLASLYTGFISPRELDGLFSSAYPWMPETY